MTAAPRPHGGDADLDEDQGVDGVVDVVGGEGDVVGVAAVPVGDVLDAVLAQAGDVHGVGVLVLGHLPEGRLLRRVELARGHALEDSRRCPSAAWRWRHWRSCRSGHRQRWCRAASGPVRRRSRPSRSPRPSRPSRAGSSGGRFRCPAPAPCPCRGPPRARLFPAACRPVGRRDATGAPLSSPCRSPRRSRRSVRPTRRRAASAACAAFLPALPASAPAAVVARS